jgi:hypothetical protein
MTFPAYSDDESQNRGTVLSLLDLAAKLVPRIEASNAVSNCKLTILEESQGSLFWDLHGLIMQPMTDRFTVELRGDKGIATYCGNLRGRGMLSAYL